MRDPPLVLMPEASLQIRELLHVLRRDLRLSLPAGLPPVRPRPPPPAHPLASLRAGPAQGDRRGWLPRVAARLPRARGEAADRALPAGAQRGLERAGRHRPHGSHGGQRARASTFVGSKHLCVATVGWRSVIFRFHAGKDATPKLGFMMSSGAPRDQTPGCETIPPQSTLYTPYID